MKKPPSKKQTKTFKLTRKMIVAVVLMAVVVLIIGVIVVDQFRHYQDKQKFMILKQDMLALQTEFNKIDKGWEYSESCHASGEKFHDNEASDCYINLKYSGDIEVGKYLEKMNSIAIGLPSKSTYENNGDNILDFTISYKRNSKVGCGISVTSSKTRGQTSVAGCHDSALDFYFPKTQ